MTKIFKLTTFALLTYFLTFQPSGAHSQCIIDTSSSTVGASPDQLHPACVGNPYNESVQIVFPLDTVIMNQFIQFDSFQVVQIWGAIPGLNYTCFNPPSCTIFPPINGDLPRSCVEVSGMPQLPTFSPESIFIEVEYRATVASIPITIRDTFETSLEVISPPQAAFTYSVNGATVSFNNNSTNAGFFQWDFGDGNIGSGMNPVHTYASSGPFQACLTASGDLLACPTSTVCQAVNPVVSLEPGFASVSHYPNPGQGSFFIQGLPLGTEIEVWNTDGKMVWQSTAEQQKVLVDLPTLPSALYLVRLSSGAATKVFRTMVMGN